MPLSSKELSFVKKESYEKYPFLMKCVRKGAANEGAIVMFWAKNVGVVVKTGHDEDRDELGTYHNAWDTSMFELFIGEISLSQS